MRSLLLSLNSPWVKLIVIFLITVELALLIPRLRFAAQAQCQTNDRNEGLISVPNPINPGSIFGNPDSVCITGSQAAFAPFKIPNYSTLKTTYYDNYSGTAVTKVPPISGNPTEANLNITGNSLFYTTGSLTMNNNPPSSNAANFSAVIFVDGNLQITNDITYGSPGGAEISHNSGLVFVVRGAIHIDAGVNRIDAVLISEGITGPEPGTNIGYSICTYYYLGNCPSAMPPPVLPITSQLLVNGSLVSLSTDNIIYFRRNLIDNTIPSEKILAQPKYLVILKDLFSQALDITIEDTCYACGFP